MRIGSLNPFSLLMVFGLVLTPLFFRIPNPYGSRLLQELHEACHTVLFFAIQMVLLLVLHRRYRANLLGLLALGCCISLNLGALIELIQPLVNRSRSWADMGLNMLGVGSASAIFCAFFGNTRTFINSARWRFVWRVGWLVMGVTLLLAAFWPLLSWTYKQALRDSAFPLLMDFEQPASLAYLQQASGGKLKVVGAPPEWQGNSSQTARVVMPARRRWPGFVLQNPQPKWTDYTSLTFVVYSPQSQKVKMAMNIYSAENREKLLFYKAFVISPGVNQLALDLTKGAPLNKHHITSVTWYSIMPEEDLTLYFDDIRLE